MRALCLLAATLAFAQEPEIRLVRVAQGLDNPVDLQSARDGSKRLFIVEKDGIIRILRDGALLPTPFLDIGAKTRSVGECGLLGLAFPPGHRDKRYFYVNYTIPTCRGTVIARYRVTGANADVADPNSEEIILTQPQPFTNHNGGQLQFGPDGFLYIGLGDGGSAGDPQNNSQNPATWLGKMLRIDTESGPAYRVPPSNPFLSDSRYRPEIWATGLRNPWRYSFDRETGDLWMGDVGQNRAEEIDFQPASSRGGENFGWRIMEGFSCFNPSTNCDRTNLTLPVLEYTRAQGDVSVTGGYVYRGTRWPGLRGTYVYGDFASGRIWGLRREGAQFNNRLLLRPANTSIATFGEDEDGELYIGDFGGIVYRIEAASRPVFTSNSVVNAASFEEGLTPGSAVSLFASALTSGPGITASPNLPLWRDLAGVRVLVNGADAPLYAVANVNQQEQVNFQAPFALTGPTARVAVSVNGLVSAEVNVVVRDFQPAVFVSGAQPILVDAASNSLLASVRTNQLIYLYATGLGQVDNAPAWGAAAPRSPLARARTQPVVTLGGQVCELQYAGLAPDFAGIYQVNLRVPAGVARGMQELVINAGSQRSPGVTVLVE
ncbi:MAG: PQQ-dependent sugar dehydrogenase [Bryobacteraceae bacterium]|nr:PQQ-dependent sugar dehydrogenase [Bryobacteraceae bacterium]